MTISLAEVVALVKLDCEQGVTDWLNDPQFELAAPTGDGQERIGNNDYTTVCWSVAGAHSKVDTQQKSLDVWPTHRQVRVEGVTIVHHMNGNLDPAEVTFHRSIDWNAVASQLGTSRGRPTAWFPMPKRTSKPPTTELPKCWPA